jgi:hypothetical protein
LLLGIWNFATTAVENRMGLKVPSMIGEQLFTDRLAASGAVSPQAVAVLEASGARTPEAILSLLQAFPTLAREGLVDSPTLSNIVLKEGSSSSMRTVQAMAAAGVPAGLVRRTKTASGYGVKAPARARWKPNDIIPVPSPRPRAASMAGTAKLSGQPIDVRQCRPWPVRDQGMRGTCVAFGVTALRELLMCEQTAQIEDLSEQFLYWDVKTNSNDPLKTEDGTWVEFAFESLSNPGICRESTWPYNPVSNPANISHGGPGAPPPTAASEASTFAAAAATHQHVSTASGNAATMLELLLRTGRPLAICLPVFSDPLVPQSDNWTTNAGWLWGAVLDPPPTSVVSGGHCVCLTGFAPDPTEPLGGYFVIRNSWSTDWGSQLPQAGYHGPEPGYGQVSATYIDRFLWEFGQL